MDARDRMIVKFVAEVMMDVESDFTAKGAAGQAAFTTDFPGKILPLELESGQSVIMHRHAFLCAEKSVKLDIFFTRRFGVGMLRWAAARNCGASFWSPPVRLSPPSIRLPVPQSAFRNDRSRLATEPGTREARRRSVRK